MARALQSGLRDGGLKRGGLHAGIGNGSIFTIASLDLNFARYKNTGSLVTFNRASSGTFVGSSGLIQSAVTNLVLRSEEFDNASWSGAVPTITPNVAIAPNGTITADRITGSGVSAVQSKTSTTLAAGQGSVAYSVYAKYETHKWLQLFFNGDATPFANYDIETGVVGSTGTNTTATITPVGDGWYRCVCVKTAGNVTDITGCRIVLVDASNSSRNAASATAASLLIWGAQLEQASTAGEYIPTTSAINSAPRFDHNPTTGESLGLLVEEARTNNLLQSEDFSSTWTPSNIAVTPNSVVAPDGTTTADTIAPPADGLTTTRFLRQNPILTTQQAYTLSVFVKVGTATTNGIALYVSDSTATNIFRANFNLFTLTTSPGGSGWATPTATIIPYPNGWYRCILSGVTSTVHVSLRAQIYLQTFGTTPDTYGTHHIWGAQLEVGAFPTSYIPTTTATVTRAADVASITGTAFSSWYRQDEGTVFSAFSIPTSVTTGGACVYNISNSSSTTQAWLRLQGGTNRLYEVTDSSTQQAVLSAGTFSAGVVYRGAVAIKTNDFGFSDNGSTPTVDNSGTLGTVDRMGIGMDANGVAPFNGHIRRLTYFPRRLGNDTLQAITQP